mgnify:CR=1 FL=1|jgi:hypothetical protein
MVSHIFDDWSLTDARLLHTDVRETAFDPIAIQKAVSKARAEVDIYVSEKQGYAVPLFEVDSPIPTNEYVIYRPDAGSIGWYDTGFGVTATERFTDCERLNGTEIGHRLRFWLDQHCEIELAVEESALPADQIQPRDQLSSHEQRVFFDELSDFVRSEKKAQRETNWQQYTDLDLGEAIRRNHVSGPYIHIGSTDKDGSRAYRYQFGRDDDESGDTNLRDDERIFPGNRCILDIDSETQHFPIEVKVRSVTDPQITIQPAWNRLEAPHLVENILESCDTEIWLHELLNPVPFDRRLNAIDQIRATETKRNLLTGNRPIEYSVNKFALPDSKIELNEYQRLALIWADAADDVVCIHGPPGTGKTRTLTAYVSHAVSEGKSVLVTAHSNQAVDNLLVGDSTPGSPEKHTLHAMAQCEGSDVNVARIGNNSRNRVVQNQYLHRSASDADVVAATTSGTAQFEQNAFDVAVVDEATQASRPATALVLNSAEKLVLAGDHKQLPPYCADESAKSEDMHISLFEYLLNRYEEDGAVLLQRQYRMNEAIAAFPNEAFYDGKLTTAELARKQSVSELPPLVGINVESQERERTHGHSFYNPAEAKAAAKQVQLLAENGVASEDIGVISPYSGQVSEIISRVNQLNIPNPGDVSVDTVDSFQGGEREAIIISFVRSNDDGYSGFLEFPDEGPRRLNVAMTRARKRLVMIGNWGTLSKPARRTDEQSCASLYERLAAHIRSENQMHSPTQVTRFYLDSR